jgi:chitodextrinase
LANTAPAASEFLVYASYSSSFTVNLSNTTRTLGVEWLNPTTGAKTAGSNIVGGSSSQSFTPPFGGDAVLYIYDLALGAPDITPPSIPGNLSATPISTSQINLTWNASMDNVSVAGYQVFRNGLQIATTTVTNFSNTGLATSTTYTYYVTAFDGSGNFSGQSATVSATTLLSVPPPDTIPPSVPTNLSASNITSSGATISWTASTDNIAVTGYQVFRNGLQIATTTQVSYNDSGLSPATTYSYTVTAFDAANNISAQSGALSVTTAVASAPIAFVQLKEANAAVSGNSVSTGNFTNSVADSNLIVAWIWYNNTTQNVLSVTDTKGNVYAKAVGPTTGASGLSGWRQEIWYAKKVIGGSGISVTATFTGTFATKKSITAHEYSGADQTNPLDVSSAAVTSTVNASSGALTTSFANELIFGAGLFLNSSANGSGFIQRSSTNGNASEDKFVTSTGSYAAVFSNSAQDAIVQMATFKAAGQ